MQLIRAYFVTISLRVSSEANTRLEMIKHRLRFDIDELCKNTFVDLYVMIQ